MRSFVRVLVVALTALVGGAATYETAVGAPTFTYDSLTSVRVGGEEIAASEAGRTDLEHTPQTSASPAAVARGRSTAPALFFVAPQSALVDTNGLIRGLERGELDALDKTLAGRTPVVSFTGAREFLRNGGDSGALRSFLSERGGESRRSRTDHP